MIKVMRYFLGLVYYDKQYNREYSIKLGFRKKSSDLYKSVSQNYKRYQATFE